MLVENIDLTIQPSLVLMFKSFLDFIIDDNEQKFDKYFFFLKRHFLAPCAVYIRSYFPAVIMPCATQNTDSNDASGIEPSRST